MREYFTFHTDDGHGWLAVTEKDLVEVGLTAFAFSRYSYRKADWFYLEEDCDMAKFCEAYRVMFGKLPKFRDMHCHGSSPIRRYRRVAA